VHISTTLHVRELLAAYLGQLSSQLSYIAEHTSDVRHLAGLQNEVADALSRPTEQVRESPPTVQAVTAEEARLK
jgi:hypothetical protein